MRKFLISLSFFTRIKINLKDVSEDEFYNSMTLLPLTGVVIGLWLGLIAFGLSFVNEPTIGAVVMIFAYMLITGGLHMDGVADTIDGLMSARDRARVMEIMKDSRLGSFGAIALILLFLANFAAYKTLLTYDFLPGMLVLAPVVGRFCGLLNCRLSTYAEGGGGLGKRIVEMTKTWHIVVYLILILAAALLLYGWSAVIALGVAIIVALYIKNMVQKGIGGMTGDTIGFTIEVSQVAFLLTAGLCAANLSHIFSGYIWLWI